MPGARCTRGLVCQELRNWRTRAYRAAETLRHPLRNGFTAYIVLSPVSGLVVTVTSRKLPAKLSASVAAPGPHDFAVRLRSSVRAFLFEHDPYRKTGIHFSGIMLHAPEQKRPPHLIPTYSDDGRRPSLG